MMRDLHMSERQAWDLPIIQAHAYAAWSTENNPWCPVERATDAYIAQEAAKLVPGTATVSVAASRVLRDSAL